MGGATIREASEATGVDTAMVGYYSREAGIVGHRTQQRVARQEQAERERRQRMAAASLPAPVGSFSVAEVRRLRDRGVPLTGIAALLRASYREVAAALELPELPRVASVLTDEQSVRLRQDVACYRSAGSAHSQ